MTIECLIVDDEPAKRDRILRVIAEELGELFVKIQTASSAHEATTLLRSVAFDMMVIDVNLPLRVGESPSKDGGIKLLRQIGRGTGNMIRPAFVVGITGFAELVAEAAGDFAAHGWCLLEFSPNESKWEESLANQCKHICSYKERLNQSLTSHQCDVCIITAMSDTELEAVQRECQFKTITHRDDQTRYYQGQLPHSRGQLSLVAASAHEVGNTATAVVASKAVSLFRPKVCVLVGICAGIGADIGEIVVADFALHYESGKYTEGEGGETVFLPQPRYQSASNRVIDAIRRYKIDHAAEILGLPSRWPGNKPQKPPTVHVGPVASGAAVVENSAIVTNLKFRDRKLAGLEMESYGFYVACSHALLPRPEFVMIKAVCDLGRPPKLDDYQKYAAFLSSSFAMGFLAAEAGVSGGIFG